MSYMPKRLGGSGYRRSSAPSRDLQQEYRDYAQLDPFAPESIGEQVDRCDVNGTQEAQDASVGAGVPVEPSANRQRGKSLPGPIPDAVLDQYAIDRDARRMREDAWWPEPVPTPAYDWPSLVCGIICGLVVGVAIGWWAA